MPSPVWRTIRDSVHAEIVAGRFRTGDRLPTEKALAARFGVNRHTVRHAMAELAAEGVVHVRRGSGAYVAEGVIDYRLGERVRFSQNIAGLGRTPSHVLLNAAIVPADPRVAEALRLDAGAPVSLIETVGEADALPIVYARGFFSAARFPDFIEAFRATLSITEALRRHGVTDYRRSWTRITAQAPSRRVASYLRQPDTQPVLRAEGLNLDMAGAPVEYALAYWAGGRTQFVVEGQ